MYEDSFKIEVFLCFLLQVAQSFAPYVPTVNRADTFMVLDQSQTIVQ